MSSAARARAGGIAVLLGFACAAPLFLPLLQAARRPVPPHAQALLGSTWVGVDGEGDELELRFNKWGMGAAKLGEGERRKGPVAWGVASIALEPIPLPLLSALSGTTTLAVTRWPSPADDTLVCDGVVYARVQ